MTYEEQLQDPRWKEKRDHILSRDHRMCQHCMSTKNLQVHHKKYFEGIKAWNYPDRLLVTLCDLCHRKEHGLDEEKDPLKKHIKNAFSWAKLLSR